MEVILAPRTSIGHTRLAARSLNPNILELCTFRTDLSAVNSAFGTHGLLSNSRESLHRLHLDHGVYPDLHVLDLTPFVNLKYLAWKFRSFPRRDDVQRVKDITRPLRLFTLIIQSQENGPLSLGDSFEYLPSSLLTLELPVVLCDPFIAFVASDACPNLRSISVGEIRVVLRTLVDVKESFKAAATWRGMAGVQDGVCM